VHLPGWQGQVDSAARARALAQVTMVCTLVVWLIVLDGWAQARLSPVWLQTFGLVG
jgi:type II secretory pathway pseudopilin PulG